MKKKVEMMNEAENKVPGIIEMHQNRMDDLKKMEGSVGKTLKSRKVGRQVLMAVDSGKHSTKLKFGEREELFPTRVAKRSDLTQIDSKHAFVVTFEGETFIVADDVNIQPNLEMSKTTIEHKICIYSAIAKSVENGAVVNLVVGIPVLLYLDQETRLEYEQFMSQPSTQEWTELTLDGEVHYFKINQVKALPETAGYVFGHYEDYYDDVVGIIDLGGLNINGCVYSELSPIHKSSFTINRGGHNLISDIQQALMQKLGRDIQDYQMKGILKKPKASEDPIIREVVDSYMNVILKELRTRNWDISEDGIKIVLTGGTSQIIKNYASAYFPQLIISEEPVWDNVKGFKVYAEAFLEG